MNKRLSKYISSFEYFYKSLIVLFIINGSISIASFATAIGAHVRITSLEFSISTVGIVKKFLKTIQK